MKLRQTLVTGSIILAAGAYKTFKDYNADDNHAKKKTLIRDVIALGVASATVFAADYLVSKKFKSNHLQDFSHNVSQKIIDSRFFKYLSQKFPKLQMKPVKMETLSDILSSCIKDISLTASAAVSGVVAGLITDKVINKFKPEKEENAANKKELKYFTDRVNKFSNNKIVNAAMNDNARELVINTTKVFEKAGFIFNPFEKTNVILSGIDIARERNYKKILEQTSTGIVAGAIIPAFIVSICNTLTRKQSLKIKIPVIAAGLYLGDFFGGKASKYLTREVKIPNKNVVRKKQFNL